MNELPKVAERFLHYVTFETQSDENAKTCPSTSGQRVFAEFLVAELKELNLSDISIDENSYVMATLPANTTAKVPTLGFIAHLDTSPDMSGKNVKPQIVKNYDGKTIVLNPDECIVLSPNDFPELMYYTSEDLIVTDGNTLLGADDKAGIAEIMTAIEYLTQHQEIKHGDIRIAFTPDEEIARGVDKFDIKKFGAKYAYTIDGGALGEIEYESFNAARGKISVKGRNVHPGYAKDKMRSSMLIASEFIQLLPTDEIPSKTESYEGFYHLLSINGDVEETKLDFIIRDFDYEKFEGRKLLFKNLTEQLNEKYGDNVVFCEIADQYYNMRQMIEPVYYIVDFVKQAMICEAVVPREVPIRGGTDGSKLSFMGMPTPNIFTGGINFHSRHEFISIKSMEKAVNVLVKLVEIFAQQIKDFE